MYKRNWQCLILLARMQRHWKCICVDLKMKENLKEADNLSVAYFNIASAYTEDEDYTHALYYLFKARAEDAKAKDTSASLDVIH